MRETATVLKINEEGVLLRFHEQEGCKNCSSLFCKANDRTFTAANTDNIPLEPGDIVTVFLPPGKTVQSSFLLLIFPLILFFLLFLLSERIFGITHELLKVGLGLIGLAAGFFLTYFFSRKGKLSKLPRIVEKTSSSG